MRRRRGRRPGQMPHVVAYDFGIKHNILRRLASHGLRVTVVPAHTTADEVLALQPDGIFLSNGPGDPAGVPYAAEAVARAAGEQESRSLASAWATRSSAWRLGAKTYKLKFGHHGGNQPVSDVDATNVQITAQNHNYAVDDSTLPAECRGDAPQPQRRHGRRAALDGPAGLLRPVSPGGQPRPARRRPAVCPLCRDGAGSTPSEIRAAARSKCPISRKR